MKNADIIIIGAGLSGLLMARLLQKEGFAPLILEARNRLGGRINTRITAQGSSIEMGATWLGKKHHHLVQLLDELDIEIYEQYMGEKGYYEPMSVSPPQLVDLSRNEEPSYRIAGGTDHLIQTLANHLDRNQIHLNQVVKAIRKTADQALEIETGGRLFNADFVISTIPPKLLTDTVDFSPALPDEFRRIAAQTHTWMAESIKVALTFDEPFWRNADSSGTIFSNVGPVNEMYDHSNDNHYALKGFMNNAYHTVSGEERKNLLVEQLRRFYGDTVETYVTYEELVWKNDPFSYSSYEQSVVPHQHNGHPIFQKPYLDGQFFISGSETATEFPGYMDGAVESALRTVHQLKQLL